MLMRKSAVLFFLVTLFLCSWRLNAGHNDNTMSRAACAASLVDRGTLEITPIHYGTGDKCLVNGRWFRWAVIITGPFGLLCALADKMTISYSLPTEVSHPLLTEVLPRVLKWEWTAGQWPVLPGLSPAVANLPLPTDLRAGPVPTGPHRPIAFPPCTCSTALTCNPT